MSFIRFSQMNGLAPLAGVHDGNASSITTVTLLQPCELGSKPYQIIKMNLEKNRENGTSDPAKIEFTSIHH